MLWLFFAATGCKVILENNHYNINTGKRNMLCIEFLTLSFPLYSDFSLKKVREQFPCASIVQFLSVSKKKSFVVHCVLGFYFYIINYYIIIVQVDIFACVVLILSEVTSFSLRVKLLLAPLSDCAPTYLILQKCSHLFKIRILGEVMSIQT